MNRRRRLIFVTLVVVVPLLYLVASAVEWRSGKRLLPWSAYSLCGASVPKSLPAKVRIGLYEEFPVPWRLDKLKQVDFPVTVAVAAKSRAEFVKLRQDIFQTYPQVSQVFFWPLLAREEGYYPGAWSDADGVQRVAREAAGLPTVWDLEMPLGRTDLSLQNWWRNRAFLESWLRQRDAPVHIWRSHVSMGLNPWFLRLAAMHFNPTEYPQVSLQLDLYTAGAGQPRGEVARILRCGVEACGERFVPALGVLNDGEGPADIFVPPDTLRRNLQLAREAGVSEIWLFGVNGLNEAYLKALKETIPLQ